uniref:poly(A)-specific ribonuclease n=1 Tax=Ditylenchus dipsaci TaxID=166011 RepID=A0A915EFX7_9BILA
MNFTASEVDEKTAVEDKSSSDQIGVTLHDVWDYNLREEFDKMLTLIDDYPFVAMDTEFPGVVVNPVGSFLNKEDFNYKQLYCNVNVLKLIQVGFTFVDSSGCLPPKNDIWQFNFHFDLDKDMFSEASIELLKTAGFNFDRHRNEGISMMEFGELLTISGLLADKRITWITFHSSFDFGYLIKSMS